MDIEHITHSFKTAIACLVGFLVTKLVGFSGVWIVVTIIVVMCAQIYVGSVLLKSYMRFLGTLIGCLLAAITLLTAGPTTLATVVTIALSSFIFSYVATAKESLVYAGTLGATTTAIILLSPQPTINVAAHRFFEISTGILIATLFSQFILPIHARDHLKKNQATTLQQLREYYQNHIILRKTDEEDQENDEDIISSLAKQRRLAKDASREPFGGKFDSEEFIQSLQCEKEILRAIIFIHIILTKIENTDILFYQSPLFNSFNKSILQAFNVLIKKIHAENEESHIHIPNLEALRQDIEKKRTTQAPEDNIYIDGLLFFAEFLTNSLLKLAMLYKIDIR